MTALLQAPNRVRTRPAKGRSWVTRPLGRAASGRAEGADDPELSSRGHGLKAGVRGQAFPETLGAGLRRGLDGPENQLSGCSTETRAGQQPAPPSTEAS